MSIPLDVKIFAMSNFCLRGRHVILSRKDKICRACEAVATEADYLQMEETMVEASKYIFTAQPEMNIVKPKMTKYGRVSSQTSYTGDEE